MRLLLGLSTLSEPGIPMIVFGHSRGGAMAILGAHKHIAAGGELAGVVACAPVSNVVERLPKGELLEVWKATNRMEVLNGRTGQVLCQLFLRFWGLSMADELNVETAGLRNCHAQFLSFMEMKTALWMSPRAGTLLIGRQKERSIWCEEAIMCLA